MTLCVFALIASEFMPVSLLTPMAADLRVSEGMAGYGMAISGVFAVLFDGSGYRSTFATSAALLVAAAILALLTARAERVRSA